MCVCVCVSVCLCVCASLSIDAEKQVTDAVYVCARIYIFMRVYTYSVDVRRCVCVYLQIYAQK